MKQGRDRAPRLTIAAAAGAVALATASAVGASGPVVSLRIGFHPGERIGIVGSVTPRPPSTRTWRVTVRVKRCIRGNFHTIWTRAVAGHPDGSFRVVYAARTRGVFFARGDYRRPPTVESGKQRFVVR
jgi:hypothetical protein